jgi:AcrR family transcriptional regulator
MSKKSKEKQPTPPPGSRGGIRRKLILESFHKCIINKGFAKTTLRDVANSADMTASHLLYYFSGKDALLKFYFESVADRITDRLDVIRKEAPLRQVELLADLFFAGKGISNSETGFMLECFGVAVHDDELHKEKAELDRQCKEYLCELFKQGSGKKISARDHAEITYSMLIGLRTAAFFDQRLELKDARRLFHAALLSQVDFGQSA